MPFVLTAALKDLRRRLTDPAALLMWMGLPIVIGLLLSLVGNGGPTPKAHLLVVDEDHTLLSRLLISGGSQGRLADALQIETVDATAGRARIDKGDANALLTVPNGFQEAVLRDKPMTLSLVTNPTQRILPVMIEEVLKMLVEAEFYVQRLFGDELRSVADTIGQGQAPPDEAVAAIGRAFNGRMRALQDTLLPPAISLEAKKAAAEHEAKDFWAMFLPGLLFMSLMFAAQGMSLDIWVEKTGATLRRAISTPRGAGALLFGKLLAAMVVMAAASFVALILGVTAFGVSIARAPLALAWCTFTGGALFSYLLFIQLLATSQRGGGFLSSMIVFPLMMIGGSFFPLDVMPEWMARIGRWTPNGLAAVQTQNILFGHPTVATLGVAIAAIGVPAIVALWVSVRRLRTFAVS
jgi:ABC-type multidrug transport system permease subunit